MEVKLNIQAAVDKVKYASELMRGRDKISTDELQKYYKTITVTAIEPLQGEEDDKHFYVYLIKEAEKNYAYSGYMLTKLFDNLIAQLDGDLTAVNKDLSKGVLKLHLIDKKSKDGKKSYTDFELINE